MIRFHNVMYHRSGYVLLIGPGVKPSYIHTSYHHYTCNQIDLQSKSKKIINQKLIVGYAIAYPIFLCPIYYNEVSMGVWFISCVRCNCLGMSSRERFLFPCMKGIVYSTYLGVMCCLWESRENPVSGSKGKNPTVEYCKETYCWGS